MTFAFYTSKINVKVISTFQSINLYQNIYKQSSNLILFKLISTSEGTPGCVSKLMSTPGRVSKIMSTPGRVSKINVHAGLVVKINKLIPNFAKKTRDGPVRGVRIHMVCPSWACYIFCCTTLCYYII